MYKCHPDHLEQHNKQHYVQENNTKMIFHLNGRSEGFYPQTVKL